ncbi:MAG: hypothetical protein ACLFM7_05855 [Bacteroidales bacterium]
MSPSYKVQVLIGEYNLENGGVIPEYQLYLSENDEPILFMKELKGSNEWVWYPSNDSILDDIFLMISSVVFHEVKVEHPHHLSLMDYYTEKERFDYYEKIKEQSQHWDKKIFLNLFYSSPINDQLENIKEYQCDVEVTKTRYLQKFDPESGEFSRKGSVYQ